jgi:hypothetical protein
MVTKTDFQATSMSNASVTVTYGSTGQTFEFQAISGLISPGEPVLSGGASHHPQWLLSWLARRVAQQAIVRDP